MSDPIIVIGSGGYAKVLIETLRQTGADIRGRTDADPAKRDPAIGGVPFLGGDSVLNGVDPATVMLVNAIGTVGDPGPRVHVFDTLRGRGFRFARVVHPSAIVAGDTDIGEGGHILAGAIIQPACRIGANTMINMGVRIDHDCRIGDHVHLAPGVILGGDVSVGDRTLLGTGAVTIQGITIGDDCLVAAGAAVTRPIADGARVGGVPARPLGKGTAR